MENKEIPEYEQPARRKLKRGELKQALIDLVLEVTFEGKLTEYTMRDFAKDLGVSPGAAYRHFETREELIEEAVLYMHRHSERLYERHLPMDLSDKSVPEIIKMICKANNEMALFAVRTNELWMSLYWSSSTSQAIFMKNHLPNEDPVIYSVKSTNNAFEELYKRGALSRNMEPVDFLQYHLTISGVAGKLAAGKMEDCFTTYGLSRYLKRGLGVKDKLDRKSVTKMMNAIMKNTLLNLGYQADKWEGK